MPLPYKTDTVLVQREIDLKLASMKDATLIRRRPHKSTKAKTLT